MEAVIYALCDPHTSEIRYIGKTHMGIDKRMGCHYRDKTITYRGKWLRGLIAKGVKPEVHILETTVNWVEAEQFWIAYFKGLGARLANATMGGEGTLGYRPTKATLEKLSAIRKGRKMDEATKEKIREKAKGNKRAVGVKRSQEFKDAVSARRKGCKMPTDYVAKLSEQRRGKPWSTKQRANYEAVHGPQEQNYTEINRLYAEGFMRAEIQAKTGLSAGYVDRALAGHPDKATIRRLYFENRAKRPEVIAKFNPPAKAQKSREYMTGRKLSEETRKKMSEAQRKRHCKAKN